MYFESSNNLQWIAEPPHELLFSNNTGGILNCQARGEDGFGKAVWTFEDERPVTQVRIFVCIIQKYKVC